MTREVVTLAPEMTLTEMDRVLLEHHVGGAPVLEAGKLLGVASRSDVIRCLYGEQLDAERVHDIRSSPFLIPFPALEQIARDSRRIADHMIGTRVADIMTTDPLTVRSTDEIELAARIMSSERVHRMPVTDSGQLVGILTSLDIVRAVAERGLAVPV